MPGPGAKGKASKKKPVKAPQVTAESQAALRDGIDNAEGWNACVDFMCDYFKLPGKYK